ncbi:MAG TPA: hypothetical protein VJ783_03000 [Pirellulales bacterium]|nr:hypothetical protein [Pirellulales bacterium]
MNHEQRAKRSSFVEYLRRRQAKRQPSGEVVNETKRQNLLAHRFLVMEHISSALQGLNVPYAIIGGHAVTYHGRPRMTDHIDLLVAPEDLQNAFTQLQLEQVSPLRKGGYTGTTPTGVRIDLVSPNQPWVAPAIANSISTAHGPMVSSPYLVISKLWDSRGSQDETDVLGVLGRMGDDELNATRQLVAQFLPNDVDDLKSLISMRHY